MLVKKISFPNPNELEDGYVYTVIVPTPKNLKSLMNQNKMDFLEPVCPFITVKKLLKRW